MPQKRIVQVNNLHLSYHTLGGETKALSDLSFHVSEGEIITIVGPSGCGKSTLLSIISGLLKPSSGKVTIEGMEVTDTRKDVGYMFQNDLLFEWRNILDNVLIGLEVQKKLTSHSKKMVEKLLNTYGLKDFKNHYPNQLSGGMRQRVALIRTLAIEPKLLLLDEPFSALDYQTRLIVADDIYNILKKEKKTALMITHDISEAISMADRVIVLSNRPARVKSIHEIKFTLDSERTPLSSREAPEFKDYFQTIWKELDIHV
ncbi:ABC transporter ATP-binding protein [Anaeromicrobium sediminis]|uniref:Spermidine/putrescine ABC transporter ATP-binding protein n=1 Tax=Anaeromicrobium sediminis TaxID=1478221 RepID=A0A267MC28_9FIRM|nr:ABC transporter ATP-binding protein [Anaeromicrobium sediminis]PAB56488.1 spermidine/putrescine ABC transporter ATP-binding protein [Anaeromicrobium sediminis]